LLTIQPIFKTTSNNWIQKPGHMAF